MAYIGPEPNPGQNREVDDISSSFNGSTTAFTLQVNSQNVSPGSSNNIIVSLGGVVQNPGTDYNIAASTITFTTAPASGLSFFGLVLGQQVDIQSLADGTSPTMSAPSITGDLSIADKIVHTGDTNTAIRFPAADTITAETAGSERVRVTSAGELLIGHSSARGVAGTANRKLQIEATDASASLSIARNGANSAGGFLSFGKSRSASTGGTTIVQDGDVLGTISFAGADGTNLESRGADISAEVDGTPGENDMPGRLVFKTSPDGSVSTTERMRIDSSGRLLVGTTTDNGFKFKVSDNGGFEFAFAPNDSGVNSLINYNRSGNAYVPFQVSGSDLRFGSGGNTERMRIDSSGGLRLGTTSSNYDELFTIVESGTDNEIATWRVNDGGHTKDMLNMIHVANSGNRVMIRFRRTGSLTSVGDIVTSASSTSYVTSSDYRLKENVTSITDGITRLKTLKPYRFNFKIEPDKTVDGFLAHEASEVVPEAVVGEKDAVDAEGNIDAQAIDQSKLVPLLTAALQEAVAKIETLETKVAALEAA